MRQKTMCRPGTPCILCLFLPLSPRVFEQPLLLQPDPSTLVLEAHIHANPRPKVT